MDTKTGVAETFLGGPERASSVTEEEAQKRIDLTVLPKDKKWKDTLRMFQKLLADADVTISQILSDNFTAHEARVFILSNSPALKIIQADNTIRFHNKLSQDSFEGVTPDVPTKLTMLYFGLPVEPMKFPLAEMTYRMQSRKPEPPRYAVDPPLHFLTAHKERNWGDEALMGKEDPSYPIPVKPPQNWLSSLSNIYSREERESQIEQPTVRLRGGGSDYDSDWGEENDNWSEDNDNDLTYSESDGEDGDGDGDVRDVTSEDQLPKQNKEVEDVTMQEIDNDGDFSSDKEAVPTPQSAKWMNLYGFQGYVPFIPGDRQTYEAAIRRLLSLGPRDRGTFSIVHFDERSNTVGTIHDSLPLKPNSTTLQYIFEKRLEEKNSPNNQHSFFAKLKHESAPEHWQPSKEQLSTCVSSVRWYPEGEEVQETDAPVSCCYLTLPNYRGLRPSQEGVSGWGADRYNAYIKTAFEVLLGCPEGPFHHAYFRLGRSEDDFTSAPPVYGLYTATSSDILSLIPNGDERPSSLRCSRLSDNEVAFVLPGYFNISNTSAEWSGQSTIIKVLDFIRQIISSAFGENAKHLKYVRLLDGRATLGPEVNRDQEYYSIRMSDDLPQNSKIGYASALSKIAAAENPFVILHPEWEEDWNVLYMPTCDGEDGAVKSVRMPSLSSTVDEFKASVFKLMQLAGYESIHIEGVKRGDAFISVQSKMENEPVNSKFDMPCFFIGPNTTDEEWFSIRARITTPTAMIRILLSNIWNWRDQVESTDIWGPRYGFVAGVQAAVKKSGKKKTTGQEKEEIVQDTARETVEETIQETTKETVQEPAQEPSGVEVLRALLREKESAKATHTDQAKTQRRERDSPSDSDVRRKAWAQQPSIFDNYGLRPWPANSGIQFPMNAPPVEHMLRTGSRMPMVSKAILTPTEQAKLQQALWDLRNVHLNRITTYPHDGYRIYDQRAQEKHPEYSHTARKCMLCNELIPRHWNAEMVRRHMREQHKDELLETLGVKKATIRRFDGQGTISIPLKRVKRRHTPLPMASASNDTIIDGPKSQEHQQNETARFCDRCGRDGNYYHDNTERAHHDTHCQPGIFNGAKCNFCTACGETIWQSSKDARKSRKSNGQMAHCSHNVDDADGPHCSSCGFNTSCLPQDGRGQHRKECKGFSAVSGRFCLYCGEEFRDNATQADWDRNRAHMVACYEKNQLARSLSLSPDMTAYLQQQLNLRMKVNEVSLSTIDPDEGKQNPENEVFIDAINSERERGPEEMDLDDPDEDPRRPNPTKRFNVGRFSQETTDSPADNFTTALREAMERAGVGKEMSQTGNLDPNAPSQNQEALRAILLRSINNSPFGEPNAAAPSLNQSRSPSRPPSPAPLAAESGKEVSESNIQKKAESPELEDSGPSGSEPDNGSDFENGQDGQQSDDEESGDESQGDLSSSKRRKRGGKKRGRKGDRNYKFSDDEDDDEDSEIDEDGKRVRLPRRPPSPNWQKMLGPEDPEFEPTDDFYCSKCFRKAPKKHNRDRSPLGRTKEIELHYDSSRCCRIRRGIGSTKRLPNRSGWIPSAEMPKPLGNLRKQFLRRYSAYSRTVYPLNASNANGSYYRSDPNNEDNKGWWDIPWPPFRGPAPLPNGWESPDVANVPVTGRARKQFKLRSEGDSLYVQDKNVQYSDDEDIESEKDINGKRKRKSRPSSAFNSRHTTPAPVKRPQKAVTKVEKTDTPQRAKADTPVKRPEKAATKVEKADTPRPTKADTPVKSPQEAITKVEKADTPQPAKKKETILQKALKRKAATPRKAVQKNTERKEPTRRSTRKRQKTG